MRMRRATSGAAFKMVCSRPADGSWARLGVNQGEAEGVDFRPRLKLSPKICPKIAREAPPQVISDGTAVDFFCKKLLFLI